MPITRVVVCKRCGKPIMEPLDGVIIHGNLYAACGDLRSPKGMIGDNFPRESRPLCQQSLHPDDVKALVDQEAWHWDCLIAYWFNGSKELVGCLKKKLLDAGDSPQ